MPHVNNNPLIYLTSFSFLRCKNESLMPSRFRCYLGVLVAILYVWQLVYVT